MEIGAKKYGSRMEISCVDENLKEGRQCEKTKEKKKFSYIKVIDLDKAYDRVVREARYREENGEMFFASMISIFFKADLVSMWLAMCVVV